MNSTEYKDIHARMMKRLESEKYFHEISSLDLSYDENEILVSIEMNANNEIRYHLQMDLDQDFIMLADFCENLSLDDIVDSYISVGDLINGNQQYEGYGLGWGRLVWILDNNKDKAKRKIDMMVAFTENPSGIYDGSENYFKLSFDMDSIVELKTFLKDTYEIISKKTGL